MTEIEGVSATKAKLDMSHGFIRHIQNNQVSRDNYDKEVKASKASQPPKRQTLPRQRPKKPDQKNYVVPRNPASPDQSQNSLLLVYSDDKNKKHEVVISEDEDSLSAARKFGEFMKFTEPMIVALTKFIETQRSKDMHSDSANVDVDSTVGATIQDGDEESSAIAPTKIQDLPSKRLIVHRPLRQSLVTIISDSICKNMYDLDYGMTQSIPGATAPYLQARLENNSFKTHHKIIILHVGTNDFDNYAKKCLRSCPKLVCDDIGNLVNTLKKRNTEARIVVSAILPRPRDRYQWEESWKEANKLLEERVLAEGCGWLATHNLFIHNNKPIKRYFKQDGLHPSPQGEEVLYEFLNNEIYRLLGKS